MFYCRKCDKNVEVFFDDDEDAFRCKKCGTLVEAV